MSYQALARKWRPGCFADVVGQEHVIRALANGLDNDRLHHAFLFTGTRGVGKTTIARILAKSLNCEQGVSSTPCGQCSRCLSVDEGRFVDLIEVDAASRTKVDDTRELLDNVQYAPTSGRYKVYLIDEVHMLSGHSFNALLKTLEEPPPHVKFLLATTDPQKLPVTVLSRCLQFNLKALSQEQIVSQLEKILSAEEITSDTAALNLLARSADGSVRDALSLLDQAIAHGGGKVMEIEVRSMLGTIDDNQLHNLMQGLVAQDVDGVLAAVALMAERSPDYGAVLDDVLLNLYHLSLTQLAPGALSAKGVDKTLFEDWSAQLEAEHVQLYYQIGLIGKRDLPLAPDPRSGFEMVMLRMLAFRPGQVGSQVATVSHTRPISEPVVTPVAKPVTHSDITHPVAGTVQPTQWSQLVSDLKVTGLLKELISHTHLESYKDDHLVLALDATHAHLLNKERQAGLHKALEAHYAADIKLDIQVTAPTEETPAQQRQRQKDDTQSAAEAAINNDPTIQAVVERFNARVEPSTVRPKN
ncbi:MAG TPA: DNA polymerase III subunit gamma/tau [Acidiferrobacteraceae bacterium]|nr:DNA polymerase III subunit gamma/tau [Acidiferrobacteraceae bacterium]